MKISSISNFSFKQIISCNRKLDNDKMQQENLKADTQLFNRIQYDSFFVHEDCLYHDVFVREIQNKQEQK